jgi:hypothetical protein
MVTVKGPDGMANAACARKETDVSNSSFEYLNTTSPSGSGSKHSCCPAVVSDIILVAWYKGHSDLCSEDNVLGEAYDILHVLLLVRKGLVLCAIVTTEPNWLISHQLKHAEDCILVVYST